MHVLITGGTGFIGRELAASLLADGHAVTVLTREITSSGNRVPNGAKAIRDLARADAVDAVVNLAGANLGGTRWNPVTKMGFRTSRIDTTRRLVDWMSRLGTRPKVLVSGSAIGWYGPQGDEVLTESAPAGGDFSATLCRDWEAEALKAAALGVRVCTVRTGIVLGPSGPAGGGALAQMLPAFRLGGGGPMGSGRQWMSWVHRADLVALIRFLIERETASGPFNGTAPEPVTNAEFAKTLGRVLKRPAILPMPGFALKLIVGEMAEILLSGQRVVPQAALDQGFRFRFPTLEAALRDVLGG
ncbi:TIGR01777 family oxidoreductase [Nevskia sp.]|uniref:TIGR01777 family oxidoreductase n=1 Tax=Nevskia sp. TaxID=1929292 RepID=UPI003F710067